MVEHPALGGTLRPGEAVILITRGEDATLTLTAADGTLLWNAWAPYSGEPPYLPPEVIEAAGGYGVWATLRAEADGRRHRHRDPGLAGAGRAVHRRTRYPRGHDHHLRPR